MCRQDTCQHFHAMIPKDYLMTRYVLSASLTILLLGSWPAQAQERRAIVHGGRAGAAVAGPWLQQEGFVEVASGDSAAGLFADRDVGTGDFHIYARLRLEQRVASGASLQIGDTFFGFDGPNLQMYLAGRLVGTRHIQLYHNQAKVPNDDWFSVEITRAGPTITFSVDGFELYSVRSFAAIGRVGLGFSPVGRIAQTSSDYSLHVRDFAVTGQLQTAGSAVPGGYSIPIVDLAAESDRQTLVDREPDQYLGHPTTVLLDDNQTIIVVFPKGHGRGAIVMKKSLDGGLTWSDRLPVPENWSTSQEVPTLFPVIDAQGRQRLIMFSGLFPIRMAVSEDDGASWTALAPIGEFGGIVAMSEVIRLQDGDYLAFFHDDGRFMNGREEQRGQFFVYQTRSTDGGLTWSRPRVVVTHAEADLCEPGVIRSPDGQQLAMLLRENSRQFNSFLTVSNDEGATWSTPIELPGALTGDRHQAVYAPDGRLFISFRDRTHISPTWGDWVGWVGTYEDIVKGRQGQYRVRLMDNLVNADTAYPGVEMLPDGTVVATTYGHWAQGEAPYILSVRLSLDELDQKIDLKNR